MIFIKKLVSFFNCFSGRSQKKENPNEQVFSRHMLLVAPITTGIVFVQLPPGGEDPSTITPPPKARVTETSTFAARSCCSMPAYGQEELASIGMVPIPAWGASLSMGNIGEEEEHIKRHRRYAFLNKRGINAPTTVIGPTRLRALEDYQRLEERAMGRVAHPLPALTEGTHCGTDPIAQTNKDEESQIGIEGKSLFDRVARAFKLERVAGSMGIGRRGVSQRASSTPEPVGNSFSMGFRRWLRDGVDPAADPRASNLYLFGHDNRGNGPKRTVFPREWDTTVITTVEKPRTVPAKYYRDFTRDA
ncbi:hypothetical protein TWF730_008637 [Orbilia blumenaviensis]|uniref:Uncharacterized protein n=1 Tax=Orbilia blumenaviensis TaxID=1796055 RepID=A0AAV9V3R3_9PEZI